MSWDYRIVKQVTKIPLGDIDTSYCIHEIFYDENDEIVGIGHQK